MKYAFLPALGLGALVLAAAVAAFGIATEASESRTYLVLGTLFPALLIAAAFTVSAKGALQASRWAVHAVGACGVAALVALTAHLWRWELAAVAVFTLVVIHEVAPRDARAAFRTPAFAAVAIVTLLAGWNAAVRLYWRSDFVSIVLERPHLIFTLAGTVILAALLTADPTPAKGRSWRLVAAVCLLVIAPFGLCMEQLSGGVLHHWSVFVGPAEQVRQGGWLLWDTPSQYGFLSTLAIAELPFSSWTSLRILNGVCLVLSAAFIFAVWFARRPGVLGGLLATAVAITTVFFVSDGLWYPSTGAFRFLWVYVLMAVVVWEAWRGGRGPLAAGSIAWVLATLWSVEAAAYATAVWMPALVWSRYRAAGGSDGGRRLAAAGRAAACLGAPLGLLALTVASIALFYRVRLGHGPDLMGYVEYALSFSESFGTLRVAPGGAFWALALVFAAASAGLFAAFTRRDDGAGQVLALAAWGAIWSTASYFVARSHDNNVLNLAPILVAALGVAGLGARGETPRPFLPLARLAVVPSLALVLLFPSLQRFLPRGLGFSLADHSVVESPETFELLTAAGGEPASLTDRDSLLPPVRSTDADLYVAKPWLPVTPLALARPLPEARLRVYLERYLARRAGPGWIPAVYPPSEATPSWLKEFLADHFVHVTTIGTASKTMHRYEPKPR